MTRTILITIVALTILLAQASTAGNFATLHDFGITNDGSSWTMAFDLTNSGPDRDAMFRVSVTGIPSEWAPVGVEPFTVTGLGAVNVDLSDGYSSAWDGKSPASQLNYQCGNGSSTGIYRVFGQAGAPSPNKYDGTTARFTFTFERGSGPDPSTFTVTPNMLVVHFQPIGSDWLNAGQTYVGTVTPPNPPAEVPEPSSMASLLGLASSAFLLVRGRSKRS